MSKWLQEKQMTAFEVTYQGKTKTLQDWSKGVNCATVRATGPGRAHQLPRRGEHRLRPGAGQPALPTSRPISHLLGAGHRGQPQATGRQCTARPGWRHRTKDAKPSSTRWNCSMVTASIQAARATRRRCSTASRPRATARVLNRSELLSGTSDVEYFAPIKYRLEPDLLVTVLGGLLVYSGDIVLSITGDKIDSGKLVQLQSVRAGELKQFKHVEAPKEINPRGAACLVRVVRPAVRSGPEASQGDTEPVIKPQEKVKLVPRVLKAGSDLQQGKLGFWGQNLLREEEGLARPAGFAEEVHRVAGALQHRRQAKEPARHAGKTWTARRRI